MRYACYIAIIAIISTPCLAEGSHITCDLSGTQTVGSERTQIDKKVNFYLDDSREALVLEVVPMGQMLIIKTNVYSDTVISAAIEDNALAPMFDGFIETGQVDINRTQGSATLAAKLIPSGAVFLVGACKAITPPQPRF